jgi:hypothetical protein
LHNCGMILEFAPTIITASPRPYVPASASIIPLFSNALSLSKSARINITRVTKSKQA